VSLQYGYIRSETGDSKGEIGGVRPDIETSGHSGFVGSEVYALQMGTESFGRYKSGEVSTKWRFDNHSRSVGCQMDQLPSLDNHRPKRSGRVRGQAS
jgi:hypothetical protein